MIQHLFFVVFWLYNCWKEAGQETVHETTQKHKTHAEKSLKIANTQDVTIAHCDDCCECEIDSCNIYVPVRWINQTLLVDPVDFRFLIKFTNHDP